jgi:hypothetical protein
MVPSSMTIDGGAIHQGSTKAYPVTLTRPLLPLLPFLSKDPSDARNKKRILSLRKELCNLVAGLDLEVLPKMKQGEEESTFAGEGTTTRTTARTTAATKTPFEIVEFTLNSFFRSLYQAIDENEEDDEGGGNDEDENDLETSLLRGTTPLVIACDKGHLDCLKYFCLLLEREVEKVENHCFVAAVAVDAGDSNSHTNSHCRGDPGGFWEALIGSPLGSRTIPDRNTAVHHSTTEIAAKVEEYSSGVGFLRYLERIEIAIKCLRRWSSSSSNGSDARTQAASSSSSSSSNNNNTVLALGEVVNAHGDTPLMIAMVNDVSFPGSNYFGPSTTISSAKRFLERWYTLAMERSKEKENPSTTTTTTATATATFDGVDQRRRIRNVLKAKNDSGGTVLSYAWMAGSVDVVQWLIRIDATIDGDPPIITAEDAIRFRETNDSMSRKWKNLQQQKNDNITNQQATMISSKQQHYKGKRYEEARLAIEECTKLLEAHVDERAERMARELLMLEDELEDNGESKQHGNHNGNSKQKPTKKKKKNRKKKKQQQQLQQQSKSHQPNEEDSEATTFEEKKAAREESSSPKGDPDIQDSVEESSNTGGGGTNTLNDSNLESSNIDDALLLTKLANGRLAVKVTGQKEEENHSVLHFSTVTAVASTVFRKRTMSLDETNRLLRDRFRQGSKPPPNTTPSLAKHLSSVLNGNGDEKGSAIATPIVAAAATAASYGSSDADSVLSALCLDVTCLLYSDQGMALNLSPAQLDAVERILKEQLQSVKKARALQERRYRGGAAALVVAP